MVWKASSLDRWGDYLTSIYTYILIDLAINLIWCTGIGGFYAQ